MLVVRYPGRTGVVGQRPIILPEFDMVIVLTGWIILPDRPFFTTPEAIARVLAPWWIPVVWWLPLTVGANGPGLG